MVIDSWKLILIGPCFGNIWFLNGILYVNFLSYSYLGFQCFVWFWSVFFPTNTHNYIEKQNLNENNINFQTNFRCIWYIVHGMIKFNERHLIKFYKKRKSCRSLLGLSPSLLLSVSILGISLSISSIFSRAKQLNCTKQKARVYERLRMRQHAQVSERAC